MKNIALLISLLFFVGCDDPTGGGKLTITKHENGKTASRGYMLNDHIKVGDCLGRNRRDGEIGNLLVGVHPVVCFSVVETFSYANCFRFFKY